MLINLMKFIRGYLKIQVYGFSPERFINLCSNRNILIWGLENQNHQYEMFLSVRDFKKLKPILKKTNTKLKITERHGLPFFLYKYRKRKMFFGGIILFSIILYILSLFIWDIDVSGNYSRTDNVILDFLSQNDVYHGMLKKQISCEQIEQMIRSEYDDIIWASAQIKGTRLLIRVQENTDVGMITENATPSDIIATKDCIITSIITRKGTPMVTQGSVVKKGDVLVSGRVDVYNDNGEIADYQYYAADADIYAKTLEEYNEEFDIKYTSKNYTENEKLRFYLRILNKKINIRSGKISYNEYDMITNESQLKIGNNFYLPFILGKVQIKEYVSTTSTYTKDEAIARGNKMLKEFCEILIEKGVQIVENNVKIHIGKKSCKIDGFLVVIEKIGKRVDTEILSIPEERTNTDELE
ncbi:sporulation protein YqfD [Candidatus Galacturonibacter soehngenii]|uniref:Sporulation protein YqfD n=1 Tax=Candidatus Galacturonatibacter soehngenii TaxID=2307010 RepID=A0A7V7QMQ6_9FIRM|nr:sporulation protein YqfD [Candidatus Galacturonibacter soehngenii]KAB1439578.1 sporulation protein YqfD [Candidatus Galacturonibacter soehngenii]